MDSMSVGIETFGALYGSFFWKLGKRDEPVVAMESSPDTTDELDQLTLVGLWPCSTRVNILCRGIGAQRRKEFFAF